MLLLDPQLQDKKSVTRQSSNTIRKGHPYGQQIYKTCGLLAAKLSVVQNGLWWGHTQKMPPLLPLCVRTEQNGLGNGLSCTQAFGVFSQPEMAFLALTDSLPVRVICVYECLWWKFFPRLKILSEIGKKYLWKLFLEFLLVDSLFLKPGKEIGFHNIEIKVV